jgi:hypothetical protein
MNSFAADHNLYQSPACVFRNIDSYEMITYRDTKPPFPPDSMASILWLSQCGVLFQARIANLSVSPVIEIQKMDECVSHHDTHTCTAYVKPFIVIETVCNAKYPLMN